MKWMKGLTRTVRLGFSRVRVQILVGTLVTICTILISTGMLSYHSISELIRENTDRYVQNVVDQSVNSLDALLSQIDTLSFQITNDGRIQNTLLHRKKDGQIPIESRMLVRQILDEYMLNNTSIAGLELYAEDEAIFPVSGLSLQLRIGKEWVDRVNNDRARPIWFGMNPNNARQILVIRKILLEQDSYERGGYLVVLVEREVLNILNLTLSGIEGGSAYLFNQSGQVVGTGGLMDTLDPKRIFDAQGVMILDKGRFLPVRQRSKATDWTIVLLVPLNQISEGLHILKRALLWSGMLGILMATLFTQALSSMITHPVRKLMKVMRSKQQDIPVKNSEVYYTFEMNELNRTYNRMVDRIEDLVETVYEKELMKSQAELRALQAQINPHFLYNTLEAFYWNILEKEEVLAEKVIALSNIFRYTVKGSTNGELVTVAEEVNHVNQYMILMLMRIGHRVTWTMNVHDEALRVNMPKLILQPLIENAIHHGIDGGEGTGCVILTIVYTQQGEVHISVQDDGKGMDPLYIDRGDSAHSRNGIALVNINRRLQMMYGQEYGLQIESAPSRGTSILFRIPTGGA